MLSARFCRTFNASLMALCGLACASKSKKTKLI